MHLLVSAARPVEISAGLRFLQGSAGQNYNRRKGRNGSFWSEALAVGDRAWVESIAGRIPAHGIVSVMVELQRPDA